jgi:hypothetical protein
LQLRPPPDLPLWPPLPVEVTSAEHDGWNHYLDSVSEVMKKKPTIKGAVNVFDELIIKADVDYIQQRVASGIELRVVLEEVVTRTQELGAGVRLREEGLEPFKHYPRYEQLCEIATVGAKPILTPEFQPNNGIGEELRPQFFKLKEAIIHQFEKLQAAHRCVVLPKSMMVGLEGWHLSQSHVVLKESDEKGRMCTDTKASGLNDGTDMEELCKWLGALKLPVVAEVARLAVNCRKRRDGVLAKFDVEAAFHRFKLHFSLAMLSCIDLDEYVLIPLVGMFGWCGSPSNYDVIGKAVDWAHTGGLSTAEIDELSTRMGAEPVHREEEWCEEERLKERSSTYVDDSALFSTEEAYEMDASDLVTICSYLLGSTAIKIEKTVGPARCLDIIGWTVDLVEGSISPSHKGGCKMYYYICRVGAARSVSVKTLESMIGTLQHYALVLPLVFGALGSLRSQLVAAQKSKDGHRLVNFNSDSKRELDMWRSMLEACLENRALWKCPLTFIQSLPVADFSVSVLTDASFTIGGGYVIPGVAFSHWKWEKRERLLFEETKQHINILELMVVVVAIWANVGLFSNKTVLVQVDNTSAIAWVNAMRAKSALAQPWLQLLFLLCLSFNINVNALHIPGVDNVIADGLSRDVQVVITSLVQQGLSRVPPMPLISRLELFQKSNGRGGLVEQWQVIQEILMAQGVMPSQPFVMRIISILNSRRIR